MTQLELFAPPAQCTDCTLTGDECAVLWPSQRKCCPGCSHRWPEREPVELRSWLERIYGPSAGMLS